jgi:predicted HTH transcriptional regulator
MDDLFEEYKNYLLDYYSKKYSRSTVSINIEKNLSTNVVRFNAISHHNGTISGDSIGFKIYDDRVSTIAPNWKPIELSDEFRRLWIIFKRNQKIDLIIN